MSAAYVPAVDSLGCDLYLTPAQQLGRHKLAGDGGPLDRLIGPVPDGWRRLYVRQEPAAFEHSDMCEDDPDDDQLEHIDPRDGGCLCVCAKCTDIQDGFCICPRCSRPANHPHRPVTP